MNRDCLKEKPLVVFLRLTGETKRRMLAICAKLSSSHNKVAEAGMLAELARLEHHFPDISPDELAVIGQARALGIDPVAAIQAAVERSLEEQQMPTAG